MTVRELIEELKQHEPDAIAAVWDRDHCDWEEAESVTEIQPGKVVRIA